MTTHCPPAGRASFALRVLAVAALASTIAACASGPPRTGAPAASTASTDQPTADPRHALVEVARAYAVAAGFDLAQGGTPTLELAAPDFDDVTLRLVSLPLATDADPAVLRVYLDADRTVRVVSDGRAFTRAPGPSVSRETALAAAAHHFRLVGADVGEGTLRVAQGDLGQEWYITLDRAIDGHPVANHPMAWGIAGDRMWATLRGDGSLVSLYAIRPEHVAQGALASNDTLAARLAAVAGVTADELVTLGPGLTWARPQDPATGATADVLTLNYCARRVESAGWQAWCVDAASGARSVEASAFD